MNRTLPPDDTSDEPWPTADDPVRVPNTSMLPGSEMAPVAAAYLLHHAVQGAHDATVYFARPAALAAPVTRQLGARVWGATLAPGVRS